MLKKHLLTKIEQLEAANKLNESIIKKLIANYVEIRPTPEGDLEDRIVVFVGDVVVKSNFRFQTMILLGKLVVKDGVVVEVGK